MASFSVGDMSQSFTLARSGAAMKLSLQRLSNELVSGVADDVAAHLSGDFGPLAGLESSLARLRGYKAVTTEAGLFGSAMQTALSRMTDTAGDLIQSLTAGSSPIAVSGLSALGADAAQKFESAVSLLNTRVADRSLFAGVATTAAPLPTGADLLDTLTDVVAGAVGAADVETALDNWFSSPTGFAASYRGGDALAAVEVAPGDSARIDITALDPAIRNTLKSLALVALIDRGVLANNADGQADLARRSADALLAGQSDLGDLSARLGSVQARIDQAAHRNTAETSALNIARADLLAIDSYEAASRLQQTQTQLETLYAVTSRMSGLTLVNFL